MPKAKSEIGSPLVGVAGAEVFDPVERLYQSADHALQQGNVDVAKDILDGLLREHPTHFRSLLLQGAISIGKRQFAKAEMYTRAALKSISDKPALNLDRAMVLTQLVESLTRQGKMQDVKEYEVQLKGVVEHLDASPMRIQVDGSELNINELKEVESMKGMNIEPQFVKARSVSPSVVGSVGERTAEGESDVKTEGKAHIKKMQSSSLWTKDELLQRKVIFVGMPQREVINSFREVRIKLLQKGKSQNVVMVSSLKPRGGGSFVAFNLAVTFALDPHKTALYVDCNPYDSVAERYVCGGVIDKGLSHYLVDSGVQLEEILYPTGVERVRAIPVGERNEQAAEFFNTERMQAFISEIKNRYPDRFIIIDAPSLEMSTEARVLAQLCDQAVLVVPFGRVTQNEVISGIEAVGKSKFSGLIFDK